MIAFDPWSAPSSAYPTLLRTEVHVWCASLDVPRWYERRLAGTLSSDERTRAAGFFFERDRERFVVCRGLLRAILGRYLDIKPDRVQFRYEPCGKPALLGTSGTAGLQFNLSHSHGLAVFAVACDRAIGIDLERVRPISDFQRLAERILTAREKVLFRVLPLREKQDLFFKCWTRREAYAKASGDGLFRPLNQIDFSMSPGESPRLLSIEGNAQEAARWSIRDFVPSSGYAAALVVEGHGWHLACWRWPAGFRLTCEPLGRSRDETGSLIIEGNSDLAPVAKRGTVAEGKVCQQ